MNFRQLAFILCIGTGIAYSDMAHAMDEEDIKSVTPAVIARQLNELKDTTNHLTSYVTSLKQQVDEQIQCTVRLTETVKETQTQLDRITKMLEGLLTSDAAAPSNS